jgi:hypothetical protein
MACKFAQSLGEITKQITRRDQLMNETLQYAGFWRRFAAYLIDGAIIAFALNQSGNLFWSLLVLPAIDYKG